PEGETAEVGQPLVELEVADGKGNVSGEAAPEKPAQEEKASATAPAGNGNSGTDTYQFNLPDIGEGIAEGTVGEWHVKEGDEVKEDGDLVQIENDKSVEELPSPVAGKIT
ncbi:biotin/lipoyl-containing protein, partial [Ligilactobacillus acidipiscis]